MKLYVMVICLLMSNVRLGNSAAGDHKCTSGRQMTVLWWSQEPYIHTSKGHAHENEHEDEEEDKQGKEELAGMFPAILSKVFKHCCHRNTTLNYTKIPEGPASLDNLLKRNDFDVVIPVGAQVGALTVRRFQFAGILESPGVAVLIKGNVSGTQLLLSVLQGWPILVFILISASLAGVVIWLMVSIE